MVVADRPLKLTRSQRARLDFLVAQKQEKNQLALRKLMTYLLNNIVLLEGKKGKGKTQGGVCIIHNLREMFGKPVVVIGSKMGLNANFGPYVYLDEKKFIAELDKIATINKSTPDGDIGEAVDKALAALGVSIMHATLVFDEAYKLFDARTSGDKVVRVFGYFVAQSRHYDITILLMAPNRDMIDKRVRRQIDWFGRCTTTCRSVPDPVTHKAVCIRVRCPHRTTVRFVGGLDRFKLKIHGPNYWNMYDTYALVGFRDSHLRFAEV